MLDAWAFASSHGYFVDPSNNLYLSITSDSNNFVAVVYNAQSIDPNGIVSLQAEYYNGL